MSTYTTPGVYVEEIASGPRPLSAVATAVAAFVGFTASAPTDDPTDPEGVKPRLVSNWTEFERLYGGFAPGIMLPHAVNGYFNNGGSLCYIVRIPHTEPAAEPAAGGIPSSANRNDESLGFQALEPGVEPTVVITHGPLNDDDVPGSFDLSVVVNRKVVETYARLTTAGERDVATVVNEASSRIVITATDSDAVPASGRFTATAPAPLPVPVRGAGFDGNEAERRGIRGLAIADEVTMVSVPDLITAATKEDGSVDLDLWKAVQTALITHCESQMNRVAILDAPPNMSAQQIAEWRKDTAMYDSKFATLYYPWLRVNNPIGSNGDSKVDVPPSGHVAGVWARTDTTRGVWKAPANEVVHGVLDVTIKVSASEQGLLNPIGVNCIRPFGTRGIRIWGARTLSSDPAWVYLNVRRLFNMVESTILEGTQWAVFEPNDQDLWDRVARTLNGFLNTLWLRGALAGASPGEAYFVKCDAETNTQDTIDLGQMICEVGIAPVKPAEFVIFRISQWQGGGEAEEESDDGGGGE